MTSIYFTEQKETLRSIASAHYGDDSVLLRRLGSSVENINQCPLDTTIAPNEMVILPDRNIGLCTALDCDALGFKQQLPSHQKTMLKNLLHSQSGVQILNLSEQFDSMKPFDDEFKALAGGALSVASNQGAKLTTAINQYENALLEYRNAPKHRKFDAKNKVRSAFKRLNQDFSEDIKQLNSRHPKPTTNPLTNKGHTMYKARYGRKPVIDLHTHQQLNRLSKFTKAAKFVGYGAIFVDAALAHRKVQVAETSGGNASKAAYEEYGALATGLTISMVTPIIISLLFPGVGLLILAGAAGLSAIAGAELGRYLGRRLYQHAERLEIKYKSRTLSEASLSVM